ncbi:hypothetical protein GGQ92_001348 [Gracilibacillus halotolerans]|uniref:Helicase ATP-binding domain-containing protein n=1 Tax=Gracilibacillus halotolerans TaxID=74386 RepID=A0A841RKT4_9BACI|nr:DEAD/DEAH box helicase family protein [Gracilibacillus halotolerans]MBB6512562.1 hypothetical protein [Gracilibacillus halotolerans]
MKILLEQLAEDINLEELPDTWSFHDYVHFSNEKNLFDYQIDAIEKTMKALYYFYQQIEDYEPGEKPFVHERRKKELFQRLTVKNLSPQAFDLKRTKKDSWKYDLYSSYFTPEKDVIKGHHFINRMSYWMATGSGKSLVIIKLFAMLDRLIKNKEIPAHDFLFLAPSEDLINQTKQLVDEFNRKSDNPYIEMINLKEFNDYKTNQRIRLGEIPIFYYRSDLISDEQKESLVDYREYDNNGNWFLFLDEAHKGDKDDSKRQTYYSILSRNGMSFNFSATFTDELDIATTVKDFKLSNFIKSGYGKNMYVTNAQYTSFSKKDDDFTELDKQKIVLKSLLLLAYVKKCYRKIKEIDASMYHSPLMITLVQSVNKVKSDLVLFFRELEKIASNQIDEGIFQVAKEELYKEILQHPNYEFNNGNVAINHDIFAVLQMSDIWQEVFNSKGQGSIEVITSNDKKELAFRLKSSDQTSSPFALIKIGDIGPWIKDHLSGYEFIKSISQKNYFSRLNNSEDINILLGSRAFYEGWDSTRPNILNYINIGASDAAKKYVMQSAGRGVRIEPIESERKRLSHLVLKGVVSEEQYRAVENYANALETLFIFATNKSAIREIVKGIREEGPSQEWKDVKLKRNENLADDMLLIPTYTNQTFTQLPPFRLAKKSFTMLQQYIHSMSNHLLMIKYVLTEDEVNRIRKMVQEPNHVILDEQMLYKDITLLMERLTSHISMKEKVVEGFRMVNEDDIQHYRSLKVEEDSWEDIQQIMNEIETNNSPDYTKEELIEKQKAGEISIEDFAVLFEKSMSPKREAKYRDLHFKSSSHHYYVPYIYSDVEEQSYMKHIIDVESEVTFIKNLEKYLSDDYNAAKELDQWFFSKLDENLDNIFIPYFDNNKWKKFKPDFLFWLKKDNHLKLVFVDPKGQQYSSYQSKVEGYSKLFENQIFQYGDLTVTVDLKLYNQEPITGRYAQYWFREIEDLFQFNK